MRELEIRRSSIEPIQPELKAFLTAVEFSTIMSEL